jgi:DNA-binding protein H-NS
MPNYMQIQAQIEKLQKEAESLRKRELAETISNIKKAIAAFGLTAEDLGLAGSSAKRGRKPGQKTGGAKRRGRPAKSATSAAKAGAKAPGKRGRKAGKKAGKKAAKKSGGMDKRSVVAPKYRDAATGATWTGRGKQPRWLAAALKGGKKLNDFLI